MTNIKKFSQTVALAAVCTLSWGNDIVDGRSTLDVVIEDGREVNIRECKIEDIETAIKLNWNAQLTQVGLFPPQMEFETHQGEGKNITRGNVTVSTVNPVYGLDRIMGALAPLLDTAVQSTITLLQEQGKYNAQIEQAVIDARREGEAAISRARADYLEELQKVQAAQAANQEVDMRPIIAAQEKMFEAEISMLERLYNRGDLANMFRLDPSDNPFIPILASLLAGNENSMTFGSTRGRDQIDSRVRVIRETCDVNNSREVNQVGIKFTIEQNGRVRTTPWGIDQSTMRYDRNAITFNEILEDIESPDEIINLLGDEDDDDDDLY